jgi:hypothetical protein
MSSRFLDFANKNKDTKTWVKNRNSIIVSKKEKVNKIKTEKEEQIKIMDEIRGHYDIIWEKFENLKKIIPADFQSNIIRCQNNNKIFNEIILNDIENCFEEKMSELYEYDYVYFNNSSKNNMGYNPLIFNGNISSRTGNNNYSSVNSRIVKGGKKSKTRKHHKK